MNGVVQTKPYSMFALQGHFNSFAEKGTKLYKQSYSKKSVCIAILQGLFNSFADIKIT